MQTATVTLTQQRIMSILSDFDSATDETIGVEFYRRYGRDSSESGIRTRRKELVDMGKVRDSGKRGKTRAGRTTTAWEAVR